MSTSERMLIAHEWLTFVGGSDKTLLAMTRAFPGARVVTAIADPATVDELLPDTVVETLWTDRLPGAHTRWRRLFPAVMAAWSAYEVTGADVLVSSSHFATKAAGRRFEGPHLCFCYTPMRIAWRPDLELARLGPALRPVASSVLPAIRRWDVAAARSVDAFAGISTAVVARIQEAYGRDARLIFPPVDTTAFGATPRRVDADYLLAFGRLVPYKGFDLAIRTANRYGYRLVVAGTGPDEQRLRAMAGRSVSFTGWIDDDRYRELLAGATALIFPGEEDFGIVPVEAQAAGCPVVALERGGSLDTVLAGTTGVLFPEPTVDALHEAIETATSRPWAEDELRSWSKRFSIDRFVEAFRAFVDDET